MENKCKNRFPCICSSKVDRFTSNQDQYISGPFYTYRQIHFTSENASFWDNL